MELKSPVSPNLVVAVPPSLTTLISRSREADAVFYTEIDVPSSSG
jgi:hypothetical protein